MYISCRDYLVKGLKAAGVDKPPFTSEKKLKASQAIRFGAVLFYSETFSRCDTKKKYMDKEGAKHKRKKVFDRKMEFGVMIGEGSDEKCQEIFTKFIEGLDRGLYIDGNFTGIEVVDADWMEEGDSILKAKLAVLVMITFDGGVYKDTDLLDTSKIGLGIQVEKMHALREENTDG